MDEQLPGLADWMTYEEAAEYLGLAWHTIRCYVQRGILERAYFYRMPLVSRKSLDRYKRDRRPLGNPNGWKKGNRR